MGVLTLKAICLREIVESFDRFNQAYSSENALLQRSFEFLQRVYSQEILSMLVKAETLKEEHLNFLLNPYLKELDLQPMAHCNWEVIRDKIVQFGYGIRKLIMSELSECHAKKLLSSADVMLHHVPNLKILHLHYICTDEHLKILSKCCPNLTELEINESTEVSNEGIKNLFSKDENGIFSHSTLQVFNLDQTNVNDEGIAFLLENIPSLQVICYSDLPRVLYNMHKKDLDKNTLNKTKIYNLTELNVMSLEQSTILHDILLICIKVCPHIKNLNFPVWNQADIDLCCKLTELRNVQLDNSYLTENKADINNFLKLRGPGLTTLKLRGFTVPLSALAQCCPRLSNLKLSNCTLECDKNNIPSLVNLQDFVLDGADFSDNNNLAVANSVLSSSPLLERLSLVHCDFFNPQLNAEILKCCNQCSLKYVDFTGSDVEFSLLQNILFACTSLEYLIIDSCLNISADNINFLCELANTLRNKPQVISLEFFGSDYSYSYSDDYNIFDPYDAFDLFDSYDDEGDEADSDYDDEDDYDDYFDV